MVLISFFDTDPFFCAQIHLCPCVLRSWPAVCSLNIFVCVLSYLTFLWDYVFVLLLVCCCVIVHQHKHVYLFAWTDGGAVGCHGKGEARVGVHEGQAVVHPAVLGGEGGPPDHAEGRAQKAPGGGAGNEVRPLRLSFTPYGMIQRFVAVGAHCHLKEEHFIVACFTGIYYDKQDFFFLCSFEKSM